MSFKGFISVRLSRLGRLRRGLRWGWIRRIGFGLGRGMVPMPVRLNQRWRDDGRVETSTDAHLCLTVSNLRREFGDALPLSGIDVRHHIQDTVVPHYTCSRVDGDVVPLSNRESGVDVEMHVDED